MAGHVKEHCDTPSTRFRREGSLWACSCGRLYRIRWYGGYGGSFKSWEPFEIGKPSE